MSIWHDEKYIRLIGTFLKGFEQKSDAHYVFRCPFCGDSKKDPNKKRGYVFPSPDNSSLVFKCHNCGASCSTYKLIQKVNPQLAKEYLLESKLQNSPVKTEKVLPQKTVQQKPKRFTDIPAPGAVKVIDLPEHHVAVQYLLDRKIPKKRMNDIWFVNNFKAWINGHYIKDKYKTVSDLDPRIVLPVRLPDGSIYGFTGRSIYPTARIRYYHISLDKSIPLMFGQELINPQKQVYVVEGNIDSMFLPNCIAAMSSNLLVTAKSYPGAVYVFDNEPRNKEIIKLMEKVIRRGEKIVIWDGMDESLKDINEMVLHGLDVQTEVNKRIYQGLKATLKLKQWRKVK